MEPRVRETDKTPGDPAILSQLPVGSCFRVAKLEALHLRATRSRFANPFCLSISSILARRCNGAILDINFRTDHIGRAPIAHLLYGYRDSLDESARSFPASWIIIRPRITTGGLFLDSPPCDNAPTSPTMCVRN